MKTFPELHQGSVQWLEARAGLVTASEAKQLLTDKLAIRKPGSEMPRTLLATKLAEKWLGPLPSFGSWAAEQGNVLEQSAFDCFAFEHDARIEKIGFITKTRPCDTCGGSGWNHKQIGEGCGSEREACESCAGTGDFDVRAGCSPDGMLPDYGVEIKSLQPVHHIKALLDGDLPEEFAAQVHFSMWVTGLTQWKFFAYSRRLPHLLITVLRDDGVQGTIQEAMDSFLDTFDLEWLRLCEKNGGPPPERKPFVPSSPDDPRKELFKGLQDPDDYKM